MLLLAWGDPTVLVDLDLAGGLELADDLLGVLVLRRHLVEHRQLLLCIGEAGQLGLEIHLSGGRLLLVGMHLGRRSSALATHFEHVGGGTLLFYMKKIGKVK